LDFNNGFFIVSKAYFVNNSDIIIKSTLILDVKD